MRRASNADATSPPKPPVIRCAIRTRSEPSETEIREVYGGSAGTSTRRVVVTGPCSSTTAVPRASDERPNAPLARTHSRPFATSEVTAPSGPTPTVTSGLDSVRPSTTAASGDRVPSPATTSTTRYPTDGTFRTATRNRPSVIRWDGASSPLCTSSTWTGPSGTSSNRPYRIGPRCAG